MQLDRIDWIESITIVLSEPNFVHLCRFHELKYKVFKLLYDDQKKYKAIMKGARTS